MRRTAILHVLLNLLLVRNPLLQLHQSPLLTLIPLPMLGLIEVTDHIRIKRITQLGPAEINLAAQRVFPTMSVLAVDALLVECLERHHALVQILVLLVVLVHGHLPLVQVCVDEARQVGVRENLVLALLESMDELIGLGGGPDEREGDDVEELGGLFGGVGELDLGGAEEFGLLGAVFAGEGHDEVGHFEG
jgi:hypothetical protein